MASTSRRSRLTGGLTAVLVSSLVALGCSAGSTTSGGGGGGDGGTSGGATSGGTSGSAAATCDPSTTGACGKAAVCAVHSYGNVAGCEPTGGDGMNLSELGCQACAADTDCSLSSGGGCVDGTCREKIGYAFVKHDSVTVDDMTLAARCCPQPKISCAVGSDGRTGCKCL